MTAVLTTRMASLHHPLKGPVEGPLVPASIPKLPDHTSDRVLGPPDITMVLGRYKATQQRVSGQDFRGHLYFSKAPPQHDFLLFLGRDPGIGNRESVGVEEHGLLTVLSKAQCLPRAQSGGWQRWEVPRGQVPFCSKIIDPGEELCLDL